MKVSELAARAGIASSAVRWYESVGILPPATRNPMAIVSTSKRISGGCDPVDATGSPCVGRWPGLGLDDAVLTVGDPATFLALLEDARPEYRDRRRASGVGRPPRARGRERRRRPRLRIVHIAPEADVDARLRALRLGFDEALSTSVCAEELLGRLALLDERARPRPVTTVEVGDDVELDLFAHELRRSGRPIHLRPKEFNLLAMLAAHPGRAYTRRQLLDRVWGRSITGTRGRSTSTSAGCARRSRPTRPARSIS